VFTLNNADSSANFSRLDLQITHLQNLAGQLQSALLTNRPASIPANIYESVNQLVAMVSSIHNQLGTVEEERISLQALARIGSLVNSSLEVDEVLQVVMDTIIRLTGAERGFLMLREGQDELAMRIARNWEQESIDPSEFAISHTVINRVASEGQPVLTTNAQEDPRFTGQNSIVAYNLRSILCVPLKVKNNLIGVIYADNRIRSGLFTQKDLILLTAFADQAAVSLENARLFASVRDALAETTELKNLMDNVFSSIASGVLTADIGERILMCNRAAEQILGYTSAELIGQEILTFLSPIAPALKTQFRKVMKSDKAVQGLEASPTLQDRGQVDLQFSISPLKDGQHTTQGLAIVLEDLTEKKKLEAQRSLFERMVSPQVIEQLDPNQLKLGGHHAEITVLFADIRGFTSFSEKVSPEQLVMVLNEYLAAAADEVLKEEGTIDKFLGDAIMAWFNAPIEQPDHTLRAIRAAWGIRRALTALHARLPASSHLSFGVGIHLGEAVLGLVGTERRLDFTAIGDSVNTAKRIQENSNPGQILISQSVLDVVKDHVLFAPVEPIQAKGKRDPIQVYEVVGVS
jgi:adenylate cyclase